MAGGPRRRRTAAKRSKARPRPPVLGNDPFERGAAPREPEAVAQGAPAGARVVTAGAAPPSPPEPAAAREPARPFARQPAAAAPAAPAPTHAVSDRLVDVERRLEAALGALENRLHEVAARAGILGTPGELREAVARLLPALRGRLSAAADLLRLLEPPERVDRFGMDPRFAARLAPVVELLYATWWRVEVRDVGRVPTEGPAIVVANHGGAVPWDALVLRHALAHEAHRDLRPLLDDAECALPVFGAAAIRAGAVRASADAAGRLLSGGGLVGVFPEGSAAGRKPWRERYRMQRFGRGGFVKVALRARAPIVPCAIVGSEEASPGISRAGWLADRLGFPSLGAAPSLRLGLAALLPLPSRWTLRFGDPVDTAAHGPEEAADPGVVNALTEQVRATLQAMIDEDVAARTSVFL